MDPKVKAAVDKLLANKSGKFTEQHRALLEGSSLQVLELMVDALPAETPAATTTTETTTVVEPVTAPAVTVEQFLAAAPSDIRVVLDEGIKLQKAKKEGLVGALKANSRNTFTDAQLRAMSTEHLEGLARLANVPTFVGAAGGLGPITNSAGDASSNEAPAMPAVFPAK